MNGEKRWNELLSTYTGLRGAEAETAEKRKEVAPGTGQPS
jgi:hypothetical protein